MYGIALYCKGTLGGVVVWDFPIVIPLQVRQLYSALPWIVAICMEYLYIVKTHLVVVVVVVGLCDSSTTPG